MRQRLAFVVLAAAVGTTAISLGNGSVSSQVAEPGLVLLDQDFALDTRRNRPHRAPGHG